MARAHNIAPIKAADPQLGTAWRGPGKLILIAGAGIAGLASALALAKRGIASHVLERRPTFAEEGAGIQIGPNGTRILAELGVAEALKPMAAAPEALRVMDGMTGREIARLPLGRWIEERHGSPYWSAHRADLHAALLKCVRGEPLVRLSMSADALEVDDSGLDLTLTTANENTWHGDALIAADGLWSTLRSATFPGRDEPAFAGRSALRAVIPDSALPSSLEHNATHLWLSPGAHVVHYPVRSGAEVAVVVVVEDREVSTNWSTDVLPAWMRLHTANLPVALSELLSQPHAWRKWSLFELPGGGNRRWVDKRVALIGDAAHPTLPFLAQGGVMALEDAAVLARTIADRRHDIPAALLDYERRRRARAASVVRASRRNGQIYHLSGLLAAARDVVLKNTRPERLMQSYDWLYGWRP